MTPSEAHKAIVSHFITLWDEETPIAIDNRRLTAPTPPFAQIDITNLSSDQRTMGASGNRRFERSGFLDVRLYGARDRGRGELDTLAELVIDIVEAIDLAGFRTYASTINELRENKHFPELWCLLVRTSFDYHQRR